MLASKYLHTESRRRLATRTVHAHNTAAVEPDLARSFTLNAHTKREKHTTIHEKRACGRAGMVKTSQHGGGERYRASSVGHRPVFQPFSIAPVQRNNAHAEIIPPDDRRPHAAEAEIGNPGAESAWDRLYLSKDEQVLGHGRWKTFTFSSGGRERRGRGRGRGRSERSRDNPRNTYFEWGTSTPPLTHPPKSCHIPRVLGPFSPKNIKKYRQTTRFGTGVCAHSRACGARSHR